VAPARSRDNRPLGRAVLCREVRNTPSQSASWPVASMHLTSAYAKILFSSPSKAAILYENPNPKPKPAKPYIPNPKKP